MPADLSFASPDDATHDVALLVIVGHRSRLQDDDVRALLPPDVVPLWPEMLAGVKPEDTGDAATTWRSGDGPRRVCAAVLPDECSRHNSKAAPHAVTELLQKWTDKAPRVGVVAALAEPGHAFPVGCAAARAFPQYTRRTPSDDEPAERRQVTMGFVAPAGPVLADGRLTAVAAAIQRTAALVDSPTDILHTDAFIDAARAVAEECGAGIDVIRGEELRDRGFGGLWGVGRAASHPPALVVLKHEPDGAQRTVCWVGKGIVYDTGGLSLKGREHMVGMKRDMGGAAAVLGAFQAAIETGDGGNLYGLLCLAENAVGPGAVRPDDILTMYSGKTVEINNTDAEGRLVLADGVAYAAQHLHPSVIVDIATLTGAQMIATGLKHAAVVCNQAGLERQAVAAGLESGDLVHPLPYCPEMFRGELDSKLADMKNSVKDRLNAQSSCAAQFIAEHLGDYDGPWLHVDMAGPCDNDERATGFGVALLTQLLLGDHAAARS